MVKLRYEVQSRMPKGNKWGVMGKYKTLKLARKTMPTNSITVWRIIDTTTGEEVK